MTIIPLYKSTIFFSHLFLIAYLGHDLFQLDVLHNFEDMCVGGGHQIA